MTPTPASTCARCGSRLDGDSTALLCAACEFAAAMEPPQALPPSASPEDPRRFGDYELLEEIAHGGMGVVYRARHVKLNRIVALKMLLLGQFASEQAIRRFQREAEAAAALRHPGIVRVYEVGQVDGQHFYTMELVEGRSLASLLQSGPLPARSAAVYLQAIAEAVAHAHAHGIVHRDLKPSNILIDLFDTPRITDFGLARRLDGTGDITLTGHIVGSPNYLAPEYLSSRSHPTVTDGAGLRTAPGPGQGAKDEPSPTEVVPIDPAGRKRPDLRSPLADLFSLGAVLYECLTGRPPFVGATLEETLLRVRDTEPVPPRVLLARLPRDIETICLKCLEKDPDRRYPGAQALAEELRRFLEGHPIQARPISPLGKVFRWAKRKPAMATMVAALLVVFLIGLGGVLWQWRRAETEAGRANRIAVEARNKLVRQFVAKGNELSGSSRTLEALPWFLAALESEPDPDHLEAHRIRLSASLRVSPRLERGWTHTRAIRDLKLSPDQRWLASASDDGSARVWDLETGLPVTPPLPHGEAVQSVRFHPNGRLLLTSSSQREHRPSFGGEGVRGKGSVRLWSLPEGQELWSSIQTNIVSPAELDRDGTRILSGCADGRARLWRVQSDRPRATVTLEFEFEHPAEVRAATFSPTGDRIATGARDGQYRVWDLEGRRLLHTLDNDQGDSAYAFYARRWQVAFSPDGRQVLGGQDYRARLWSLERGTQTGEFELKGMLMSLGFSPDGASIVSADMSGSALVWSTTTGQQVSQIQTRSHGGELEEDVRAVFEPSGSGIVVWTYEGVGFWNSVSGIAKPPRFPTRLITKAMPTGDGRHFVLGTSTGQIQLWSQVHEETTSRVLEHGAAGTRVWFSPDGRRVVTGSWSAQVGFWDVGTGRSMLPEASRQRSGQYGIRALEPSPDGTRVLATDAGGTARVYEVETGKPVSPMWTNTLGFHVVGTFLPDGQQVATADRAGVLRVVRLSDGACLRSVTNTDASPFQQVLVSQDGTELTTVSNDGRGRRWKTATLEPSGEPFDLGGVAGGAEWSSDRKRLLTWNSSGGGPRVWDASTGRLVFELVHPLSTPSARFSPDGRWIGTASADGTVSVWDAQTGGLVRRLPGEATPFDLKFSPNSRWLALGSVRGVRVWEVATGETITPLLRDLGADGSYANGIAFSPDQRLIAGSGAGDATRIWDLQPAAYSVSEWRQLIPALTGKRVDPNGELEDLTASEWQACHDQARTAFPSEFTPTDLQTLEFLWRRSLGRDPSLLGRLDQAVAGDPPDNAFTGFSRYRRLRAWVRLAQGDVAGAAEDKPTLALVPRDPGCSTHQIDLGSHYNRGLGNWGFGRDGIYFGGLTPGLHRWGDVLFDVRGGLVLDGNNPDRGGAPRSALGIPVEVQGRVLHVVQGAMFEAPDGTRVGDIVLHYADGTQHAFPIVYGEDTRNWWTVRGESSRTPHAQVVWRGESPVSAAVESTLRLYLRSYPNPYPDKTVRRIDIVSAMHRAAPLVVAMTLE